MVTGYIYSKRLEGRSMYANLAILALFVFFYSLVSRDIGKTPFNGAVVFTAFGLLPFPPVKWGFFYV